MAKDKFSKRNAEKGYASMFYSLGKGMAGGVDRAPGTFASIGGLFSYGTHRDGRYGIIDPVSGRFIPSGGRYGKGDGNNNNNNNNNNDGNGNGKGRDPFKVRDFEFKPRLNQGASWNRTVGAYMYPNDKKDASNRGPIRHDGQNRSVIPDTRSGIGMKSGGLVRGAGKAERGRGKGKMV